MKKVVRDDPAFANVALPVDVFHFKCKHSEKDTFCQENCNPALFPELISDDGKGWYFNSSIAEQTNVWLGGFHAICREMSPEQDDKRQACKGGEVAKQLGHSTSNEGTSHQIPA